VHVSNDFVMRDVTIEMRNLCVSVLRTGASRLCVSHVVSIECLSTIRSAKEVSMILDEDPSANPLPSVPLAS
jgi:hypothetical protein